MSHIKIIRDRTFVDSIGQFGSIEVDGKPFSVCVENGDKLIPEGSYVLVPHDSPKHPNTLAFVNPDLLVFHQPGDAPPGTEGAIRTDCLLHVANFPDELEGCCAPGETVARFPQRGMGVTNSLRTMNTLLEILGTRTGHTAEIVKEYA